MDSSSSQITMGVTVWVTLWAVAGFSLSAVAWSQSPTYKDFLLSTLGIGLEAFGMEVSRGHQALVVPLAAVLFLALFIRYLPDDKDKLCIWFINENVSFAILFFVYFMTQTVISLLAFTDKLNEFIPFPGQ